MLLLYMLLSPLSLIITALIICRYDEQLATMSGDSQ